LTEQAGIGGDQAYGRAGVLELGGFANLTSATDYFAIGLSPTIGYFFMDNFQLSAIVNLTYTSLTTTLNGVEEDQSSTQLMLLAEPSVHLPFSRSLYGFLGVGFGLASQSVDPGDSAGAGFAIAPRLGINVMVGRSGILTPALQGVYQTTEAIQTPQGAVVAVKSSFGLNVGYTVMW
jgi:opacity protein-like surface antigen